MSSLMLPWQDDPTETQTELQDKHERILAWLAERQADALVIGRHETSPLSNRWRRVCFKLHAKG